MCRNDRPQGNKVLRKKVNGKVGEIAKLMLNIRPTILLTNQLKSFLQLLKK